MNAFETYRKAAKLTQEAAAAALGVSRSAVTKWETGKSLPTAKKLPYVAELCGCMVDDLICPEKESNVNDDQKEGA